MDDDWLDRIIDMQPDRGRIYLHWEVTEDLQEVMPYFEWGWDGYVPMVLYRS